MYNKYTRRKRMKEIGLFKIILRHFTFRFRMKWGTLNSLDLPQYNLSFCLKNKQDTDKMEKRSDKKFLTRI